MSEVTYNRVNWKDTPSTETPINATNLNKMDKGIADVAAAVNECFQSASEGKTLIAAALTGKGQASTAADTFAQMAAKIGNLMAVPTDTKNITSNGNNIDVTNYAKVNVAVSPSKTGQSPAAGVTSTFENNAGNTTGYGHVNIRLGNATVATSGNTLTITIPETICVLNRLNDSESDPYAKTTNRNITITCSI